MSPNQKKTPNSRQRIGKRQTDLLASLSNALSVSGDEQEVREIVLREVKPICQSVKVDALGNVLATRIGSGADKVRVMIAAHMDEVGFMLTQDEGDGLYSFSIVGGIDERQLVGKPVIVGREHIPGIIEAGAEKIAQN